MQEHIQALHLLGPFPFKHCCVLSPLDLHSLVGFEISAGNSPGISMGYPGGFSRSFPPPYLSTRRLSFFSQLRAGGAHSATVIFFFTNPPRSFWPNVSWVRASHPQAKVCAQHATCSPTAEQTRLCFFWSCKLQSFPLLKPFLSSKEAFVGVWRLPTHPLKKLDMETLVSLPHTAPSRPARIHTRFS